MWKSYDETKAYWLINTRFQFSFSKIGVFPEPLYNLLTSLHDLPIFSSWLKCSSFECRTGNQAEEYYKSQTDQSMQPVEMGLALRKDEFRISDIITLRKILMLPIMTSRKEQKTSALEFYKVIGREIFETFLIKRVNKYKLPKWLRKCLCY